MKANLFFGHGRQGVGSRPLRYTATEAFNTAVLACLAAHQGQPRYLGGYPTGYLQRGPTSCAWLMPSLSYKSLCASFPT